MLRYKMDDRLWIDDRDRHAKAVHPLWYSRGEKGRKRL
jgi:hypothetical protein